MDQRDGRLHGDGERDPHGGRRLRDFCAGVVAGVVLVVATAFVIVVSNWLARITVLLVALLPLAVGLASRVSGRLDAVLGAIRESENSAEDPYRRFGYYARWAKVRLQMLIGVVAVLALLVQLADGTVSDADDAFRLISFALAIAAVIELAYTLFTPGPDEALDPLALGLSAALLLQLAKLEKFDSESGIATFLFALALGVLFVVRQHWSANDRGALSRQGWPIPSRRVGRGRSRPRR
jgi:hypothetical protein